MKLSTSVVRAVRVLAHIHQHREDDHPITGRDLVEALGADAVRGTARQLAKGGLIHSHRGRSGGYRLARSPETISVVDIIDAIEGQGWASPAAGGLDAELSARLEVVGKAVRKRLKSFRLADLLAADSPRESGSQCK